MKFITILKNKFLDIPQSVKVSIILLICGILQRGISVITTPIFTRLLNTSEYGQYSLYTSWSTILIIFITLNLSSGVYTQGYVKFDENKDKFTSSLIGLTVLIVFFTYIIYLLGISFWNNLFDLNTVTMNCMFISLLFSSIFGFWEAQQRVNLKYKMYVVVTLSVALLKPILGIISIFLFPSYKVEARIMSITIVEVIVYLIPIISLVKKSKIFYDQFFWIYALKFNIPLIPHYLSQSILSQSDRIMISKYCSSSDVGIYSLAYSLSMLLTIVNNAIINILSPWIYKCIKDKNLKNIGTNSYYILLLVAILNLLLILVAPEIVTIFAPKSYQSAIWVIPPVAMSVYFMFMYTLFANFSFYFEKTTLIMIASAIAAFANVVLNSIFIPRFGYVAAAYTTLVCYILFDFFHYLLMKNICKNYLENYQAYDAKIILLISCIFVFISFVFMTLFKMVIIRYLLVIVVLIFIFIYRNKISVIIKQTKN
ncbi:lipopolysaccharide biosynthesis protein [Longibaculum muris]|uniref:lipopolysaccharide biosynthesis protein n=1 Tax=Longibaculum muris TaxID=1796628 RepID=UPI0018A10D16|nr:oligosaccharide flippase family protein [Longibaculum muris]